MSFSLFGFYNALIVKNLQNTPKNCIKTPDSLSVILQAILPNLKSQSFAENKSFVPDVRMSHSALFSRHSAIPRQLIFPMVFYTDKTFFRSNKKGTATDIRTTTETTKTTGTTCEV